MVTTVMSLAQLCRFGGQKIVDCDILASFGIVLKLHFDTGGHIFFMF